MNLDQIPKSVDDRGLALTISILVLIAFAAAGYLAFLYFKKKVESSHEDDSLQSHPMFAAIKRNTSFFIPSLPISEPLRAAVFRDMLTIKFKTISERFMEVACDKNLDNMTRNEFSSRVTALVIQIVDDYEARSLKEGIPQVVIDKFREWHEPNVSHLIGFVDEVCRSDWYTSNGLRLSSIMDFVTSLLSRTLLDAEHTLHSLNGQLDPVVYKGIKSQRKPEEH